VNSLIERVKSAMVGLGTGWILALMLLLSIMSLAIMLERAWLYWSLRDDIEDLMRDLGRLLRGGDLQGARRRLEGSRSAEAAVVVAGLVEADRGVEAAEEAMQGASALQRMKLEKRLAFLGTLEGLATLVVVNLLEPLPHEPEVHHELPIPALLDHAAGRRLRGTLSSGGWKSARAFPHFPRGDMHTMRQWHNRLVNQVTLDLTRIFSQPRGALTHV